MRFATWNLWNYADRDPRQDEIAAVLAGLDADVIAVQEVCAPGSALVELAETAGLRATAPEKGSRIGEVLIEPGGHRFGVGLLWRPDTVRPMPGQVRAYGAADFWHGLIRARFRVEASGAQLDCGSFHATPFGRHRRRDEAERVVSAMTRPRPAGPGLVGGDWNCSGEDTALDPDPFADRPWSPDNVYQCEFDVDERGTPMRWWADREPSTLLHVGGLVDAEVYLHRTRSTRHGLRPATTCGHHPNDPFGPRRIDAVRATRPMLPALRAVEVVDTEATRTLSDHLPVVVTVDDTTLTVKQNDPT